MAKLLTIHIANTVYMLYDMTASIVAYKNDSEKIRTVLNSVLGTRYTIKLFLIDNSPTNRLETELKKELEDRRVVYLHNSENVGFGQGHNIAIRNAIFASSYHIVLNPDLKFSPAVVDNLFEFMEANPAVGQALPKVYYENGSLQKLCKLLPGPIDLFGRRFFRSFKWAAEKNKQYEIDGFNYDNCINLPNLSGCFMFLRSNCLAKTGGFDKRFFMYLEDVDLTRRIHKIAQTIFYPFVSITHECQRGSYNNKKLLLYHIMSAIKYFCKWGWIIDKDRQAFNNSVTRSVKTGSYANFNMKPGVAQDQSKRTDPHLLPA
ncbi:MAG: glycosyltransferase [Ferruginibacter sp.]